MTPSGREIGHGAMVEVAFGGRELPHRRRVVERVGSAPGRAAVASRARASRHCMNVRVSQSRSRRVCSLHQEPPSPRSARCEGSKQTCSATIAGSRTGPPWRAKDCANGRNPVVCIGRLSPPHESDKSATGRFCGLQHQHRGLGQANLWCRRKTILSTMFGMVSSRDSSTAIIS